MKIFQFIQFVKCQEIIMTFADQTQIQKLLKNILISFDVISEPKYLDRIFTKPIQFLGTQFHCTLKLWAPSWIQMEIDRIV